MSLCWEAVSGCLGIQQEEEGLFILPVYLPIRPIEIRDDLFGAVLCRASGKALKARGRQNNHTFIIDLVSVSVGVCVTHSHAVKFWIVHFILQQGETVRAARRLPCPRESTSAVDRPCCGQNPRLPRGSFGNLE